MEKGQTIQLPEKFHGGSSTQNIPLFAGENAFLWVMLVDNYFVAHPTISEEERLQAVMTSLRGHASAWFEKWKDSVSTATISWATFKTDVLHQFESEAVLYPFLALLDMRQTGTVEDYIYYFNTLVNSLTFKELNSKPAETLKAIFIKGLAHDDVKLKLASKYHESLSAVQESAGRIEEEMNEVKMTNPRERSSHWFQFMGQIGRKKEVVKVDPTAPKSWILEEVADQLGLTVSEYGQVVKFGNTGFQSLGVCRAVKIKLNNGLTTKHDLLVVQKFDGGRHGILLGHDWVHILGKVEFLVNNDDLSFKINVLGEEFILKGEDAIF